MDPLTHCLLTALGATALTDLWAGLRRRLFGLPPPDWALVGRWFAHLPRGRLIHRPITGSPALRGERAIGWGAHYAIGVTYAALLPLLWGPGWAQQPSLLPAMVVGLGSVAAPFLLLQPGMGVGLFAHRAPRPWSARAQTLLTHAVFGFGLYLAGSAATWLGAR